MSFNVIIFLFCTLCFSNFSFGAISSVSDLPRLEYKQIFSEFFPLQVKLWIWPFQKKALVRGH